MFDSLFKSCPVCNEVVLLDQTQAACARKHKCSSGTPCPLHGLFTELDFRIALAKDGLREKGY